MSGADWLSYSLQDFLMFGPQVFLRLFVRINQDCWPWQLLAVPLALLVPWLVRRSGFASRRWALVIAAAAWIASGYGFLVGYYGEISWPAIGFGWAFVAQGVLLAVLAARGIVPELPAGRVGWFSFFWLLAVVALPWVTVLQARELKALALFGLTPCVTVVASLMLMALTGRAIRWLLLPLPVLWSVFSAAVFWAMQAWWLMILPLAALILLGAGFWLSPSPVKTRGWRSARRDPARQ